MMTTAAFTTAGNSNDLLRWYYDGVRMTDAEESEIIALAKSNGLAQVTAIGANCLSSDSALRAITAYDEAENGRTVFRRILFMQERPPDAVHRSAWIEIGRLYEETLTRLQLGQTSQLVRLENETSPETAESILEPFLASAYATDTNAWEDFGNIVSFSYDKLNNCGYFLCTPKPPSHGRSTLHFTVVNKQVVVTNKDTVIVDLR